MITYIIKTVDGKYYCGKTTNLDIRLDKHKKEKKPNWFGFKDRKYFILKLIIVGDFEKQIKRFGIKQFLICLKNVSLS